MMKKLFHHEQNQKGTQQKETRCTYRHIEMREKSTKDAGEN